MSFALASLSFFPVSLASFPVFLPLQYYSIQSRASCKKGFREPSFLVGFNWDPNRVLRFSHCACEGTLHTYTRCPYEGSVGRSDRPRGFVRPSDLARHFEPVTRRDLLVTWDCSLLFTIHFSESWTCPLLLYQTTALQLFALRRRSWVKKRRRKKWRSLRIREELLGYIYSRTFLSFKGSWSR